MFNSGNDDMSYGSSLELMCHSFMELSMLKIRELCKYLGNFVRCDVFLCWFCIKIKFGAEKEQKVMKSRRKATYELYLRAVGSTYKAIGRVHRS